MSDNNFTITEDSLIIITDLDGTLLDSSYSYEKALPAIELVRAKNIPLIFCSSKTRPEIEHYRAELKNVHPFISENGGGIFIPKDLSFNLTQLSEQLKIFEEPDCHVIKLGADYADLRAALLKLSAEGFELKGFGDMSAEDVAELTGLCIDAAQMARMRDFDETFVFEGDSSKEEKLKERITDLGFRYTQGEYFHIMGDSDKGRAVEILKRLYSAGGRKVSVAAFGDSPNDIEMLQKADHPFVVKKKDGSYHPQVINKVQGCMKADGIGPEGWNRAVIKLITDLQPE